MKHLLTHRLKKQIPSLHAVEGDEDPLVQCRLYNPATGWSWFLLSYDRKDTCLAYVVGFYPETGYVRLSTLAQTWGVRLDPHFKPVPLSTVRAKYRLEFC